MSNPLAEYAKMKLVRIADELRSGEESPVVTVRMFMLWFLAERRGYRIVQQINDQLKEVGLRTIPNFEYAWIDAPLTFELIESASTERELDEDGQDDGSIALTEGADTDGSTPVWVSKEATYRISRLAAANQSVVAAKPDEPLSALITRMMAGGFLNYR